jgi:hypothetical protein
MATKCKFCNSISFGSGCSRSPHKCHEHGGMDEKRCVFCNSMSYGGSCTFSPFKTHRHGSGANKCAYAALFQLEAAAHTARTKTMKGELYALNKRRIGREYIEEAALKYLCGNRNRFVSCQFSISCKTGGGTWS